MAEDGAPEERLAALVHPPRFNITRYYGMFAPAARLRPRVIREREASAFPGIRAVSPDWRLQHPTLERPRRRVAVNQEITHGLRSCPVCSS